MWFSSTVFIPDILNTYEKEKLVIVRAVYKAAGVQHMYVLGGKLLHRTENSNNGLLESDVCCAYTQPFENIINN